MDGLVKTSGRREHIILPAKNKTRTKDMLQRGFETSTDIKMSNSSKEIRLYCLFYY